MKKRKRIKKLKTLLEAQRKLLAEESADMQERMTVSQKSIARLNLLRDAQNDYTADLEHIIRFNSRKSRDGMVVIGGGGGGGMGGVMR